MNLSSDAWCDLIFEGRNQAYGAYYLRKTSSKRHLFALSIVIGFVVLLALALYFFGRFRQVADMDALREVNFTEQRIMQGLLYDLPPPPKKKTLSQEKKSAPAPQISKEAEDVQNDHFEKEEDRLSPDDSPDTDSITNLSLAEAVEVEAESLLIEYDNTDAPLEFRELQSTIVRYVYQQVRYPEIAYQQKIEGRVVFSLIINTDGSASDIKLEEQNYVFFEQEVLRALRSMPTWKPAQRDGKPLKVKFVIPVLFSLRAT